MADESRPPRYGPDDQLGAGNELTPERTLAALRLPTEGRIVELGRVLHSETRGFTPHRTWHQVILAGGAVESIAAGREGHKISFFEEQVSQTYHIGTHLDALGHVGIDGVYYNGTHLRDFFTPAGLLRLGVEQVRPWVGRGVCLDVAALEGAARLPSDLVITPAHLEAACARQGVEIAAGDAVILHTGWGELHDADPEGYHASEPGPGLAAARWLTDRRVTLVAADNWGLEAMPPEEEDAPFIVHQHLLAEAGTYIVENLTTAELVACGRSEFLFVMTPAKTQGSTGAMVAPLAVI